MIRVNTKRGVFSKRGEVSRAVAMFKEQGIP
jgi:hypothetical protein